MTNGLLIQGNNVHVFKYVDAAPLEVVCATDMNLTINQELIGITTPDSGIYKEVMPRLIDFSLNLTGVSTSNNDGDISVFYMLNDIRSSHDLEVIFTDNNGTERSFRADFYIETNLLNAPADGMSGYDMNLRGSGGYTLTDLIDPDSSDGTNITSSSYTISGGVVQDNDWIGLADGNIIEVCREGTEQLSMNLPYTFNSGTGEITPDPSTTIDGQKVFVVWIY